MRRLAPLCLVLLLALLHACGNAGEQQATEQTEQELAECRGRTEALRADLQQLRDRLDAAQNQAPSPAPPARESGDTAAAGRIRQLEYTLNRAYIDMKAALMESERQKQRADMLERENRALRDKLQQPR